MIATQRGCGSGGEIAEMISGSADEHHRRRVDDVLGGQAEVQELARLVGESRPQDVEQAEHRRSDLPTIGQDLDADRVVTCGDDCRGRFGRDVARRALSCSNR